MRSLRIGLLELPVADERPEENLDRVLSELEAAPAADLYLLPELWTTGYAHDSWEEAAVGHTLRALDAVATALEHHGEAVRTGVAERKQVRAARDSIPVLDRRRPHLDWDVE